MALLLLFLALHIIISEAQTCSRYTAGSLDRNPGESNTVSAIYVNNRADQDASCSGTVYAWNYCYYDENSENNLEITFGVFSFGNNTYRLRQESYYHLHLDTRETEFTCQTIALEPSEYFEMQENDRVGACLRRNGEVDFLDILKDRQFLEVFTHVWSESDGGCEVSDMMMSPQMRLSNLRSNSLHLYVDINIDECAVNEDDCSDHATCSDIIGGSRSYQCTCNDGFSGNGITCNDINECETSSNTCTENTDCINTDGSYFCSCSTGFSRDGVICNNIDECRTGTHNCGEQAVCIDTEGSFSCGCNKGYSGDGIICNDNNECEVSSDVCDSNAVCENSPGSYHCTCRTGYIGDGMSCFDVNECEKSGLCGTNSSCFNTDGSFVCLCNSGYTSDGIDCLDIDECTSEPGPCDPNAVCNNVEGSFTCQCPTGFVGDGLLCQEGQGGSDDSGSSLPIVVGVLGSISGLSIIFIISAIIFFCIKPCAKMRKKKDTGNSDGIDNILYGNPRDEGDNIQLNAIATNTIYDYPTLSTSLTNSKRESSPHLELYSSMDYRYMINISENLSSVSFHKEGDVSVSDYEVVPASDYEMPYYTPSIHKGELYSQLRQQNIKAIPKKEIEIAGRLGGGEFGDVVMGHWKSTDYSVGVALKTLSGEQEQDGHKKLLQEAAIMSQFKHPNVVKLYGVVDDDIQSMLVLELLGRGDLREVLVSMSPDPGELVSPQTPMLLLNYCQQIATGLQYLSRKNFVHRDLAARNILISNNNTCKICDFGMARNLIEEDYYISQGGKIPLKWTAPEALVYRKYTTASDVWSYGCVLYEVWSLGHKPFGNISNQETLEQVEVGYRLPPPPGCPHSIYSNMIHCWHPTASSRPTADELVLALMENEETVLKVPEEYAATNRQAGTLGAPLEAGKHMYKELQLTYYWFNSN